MPDVVSTVEQWKEHVLECAMCKHSKSPTDLCPVGREFWKAYYAAQAPVQTPASPPTYPTPVPSPAPVINYVPQPLIPILGAPAQPANTGGRQPSHVPLEGAVGAAGQLEQSMGVNMPDARFIANIAERVASKVIARTETGSAIAVPMEKTSKAISFVTAPGVILNMPERDIEVYAEMRQLIMALASLSEMVGKTILVREETKRASKDNNVELDDNQTAMIVMQIGSQFGARSESDLYAAFSDVAQRVLRIGDRMGSFMKVDDDTRKVIRVARSLGIHMQSELERSYGGRLPLDEKMRNIVRGSRLLAMDLQGEIERRIGT